MTFTVRDLRNIGKTCLISARLRPAIVGHTTRVINNRTTYLALIDVDIALRLVKPTKMGRPRTKVEWYKKLEKAIKEYRNAVATQTKV